MENYYLITIANKGAKFIDSRNRLIETTPTEWLSLNRNYVVTFAIEITKGEFELYKNDVNH